MSELSIKLNTSNRIAGQKFGRLTVIEQTTETDDNNSLLWLCECECGNQCLRSKTNLRRGHHKFCGCLWKEVRLENCRDKLTRDAAKDLTGSRFGLLEAVKKICVDKHKTWVYECTCICGAARLTTRSNLQDKKKGQEEKISNLVRLQR